MTTIESRWFFDRRPSWFPSWETNNLDLRREERTDWYAPIQDARSSVKLRGNPEHARQQTPVDRCQLEAKMQLDSSQRFPDQNERKLSWKRWKKHPLRELRMNDAFDAKLIRSCMSVWVRVRKQRQLRTVPLEGQRDADGNHTELQTEWAHVELLGREWWTLCFEVECAIEEHEESNLCRQMIRGVEEAVFDGTSQMSFPSGNIPEFPCQSWPEFIAAQLPSR